MNNRARQIVQGEHVATFPAQVPHQVFELALTEALAGSLDRGSILWLFGNRVSYSTIRDWRKGRSAAPRWAWRILEARLTAIVEHGTTLLALARNPPAVAPGQGSHRNICKWNQRRYAAKPVEPPNK